MTAQLKGITTEEFHAINDCCMSILESAEYYLADHDAGLHLSWMSKDLAKMAAIMGYRLEEVEK